MKAIEEDRGELDVAPLGLRLGATFAGVAPGLAANVSRRFGNAKLAGELAANQRDKR